MVNRFCKALQFTRMQALNFFPNRPFKYIFVSQLSFPKTVHNISEKENKNVKKLAESSSEDESENNQSDDDADSDSQSENGSDGESDKSDDSADAAGGIQSDEDSDDDLLKLKPSEIEKETSSSIKLTVRRAGDTHSECLLSE